MRELKLRHLEALFHRGKSTNNNCNLWLSHGDAMNICETKNWYCYRSSANFPARRGATLHTARRSMEVLKEKFSGCLIFNSRIRSKASPSPDIAPHDFSLWVHLKERVSSEKSRTIQELKVVIQQEIEEVPQDMKEKVMENFRKRLQLWVNLRGHLLKGFIF